MCLVAIATCSGTYKNQICEGCALAQERVVFHTTRVGIDFRLSLANLKIKVLACSLFGYSKMSSSDDDSYNNEPDPLEPEDSYQYSSTMSIGTGSLKSLLMTLSNILVRQSDADTGDMVNVIERIKKCLPKKIHQASTLLQTTLEELSSELSAESEVQVGLIMCQSMIVDIVADLEQLPPVPSDPNVGLLLFGDFIGSGKSATEVKEFQKYLFGDTPVPLLLERVTSLLDSDRIKGDSIARFHAELARDYFKPPEPAPSQQQKDRFYVLLDLLSKKDKQQHPVYKVAMKELVAMCKSHGPVWTSERIGYASSTQFENTKVMQILSELAEMLA